MLQSSGSRDRRICRIGFPLGFLMLQPHSFPPIENFPQAGGFPPTKGWPPIE
jgi:hypothetical protein